MPATKTPTKTPEVDRGMMLRGIVDAQKHEERMAKIRKHIEGRREELNKCLDADYAARVEARKPVYDYDVSATINTRRDGKMISEENTRKVTAQNEATAWAMFCDQIQSWPNPNMCGRKIKRVS